MNTDIFHIRGARYPLKEVDVLKLASTFRLLAELAYFGYRVVWLAPEKFRDYEQGLKERGQEVYKAARTKDHTERQRAARENKFGGGSSQDVGAGADADTPAEPAEPAGVQDVDMLDVGGPDEGETMVIDAANVVAELLEEGPAEQCARMSLLLLSPLGE